MSKHAILLRTAGGGWSRIENIPGSTPLLISNRLLRDLDATIRVREGTMEIGEDRIPMRLDERGLSIVDLSSLLEVKNEALYLLEAQRTREREDRTTERISQKDPSPRHKRATSSTTTANNSPAKAYPNSAVPTAASGSTTYHEPNAQIRLRRQRACPRPSATWPRS